MVQKQQRSEELLVLIVRPSSQEQQRGVALEVLHFCRHFDVGWVQHERF
jgi:hypothetical protein